MSLNGIIDWDEIVVNSGIDTDNELITMQDECEVIATKNEVQLKVVLAWSNGCESNNPNYRESVHTFILDPDLEIISEDIQT